MNTESISRAAVIATLKEYFRQYIDRPLISLGAFSLSAIGNILIFFIPPLIIARLVNIVATGEHLTLLSVGEYVLTFGGVWLLGEAFWRFGMHLLIRLETCGFISLGRSSFHRLIERDHDFYTNNFVGSLTKKVSAFARNFEVFSDTLVFNVINNILPMIFALIVLGRYSVWFPVILIVSLGIVIIVALPIVRKRSKLVADRHLASSKVSGDVSDVVTNIFSVKSFAKEDQEWDLLSRDVVDYAYKFKKAADYQNLRFDILISPLYVTVNVLGLAASVYFVIQFGLLPGTMVVVYSYYSQVTRVFWEINRVYRNLENSISESAEFVQLVIDPPAIKDQSGATPLVLRDANISFKDVSFRYQNSGENKPFLDDFNLDIRSGQRIGLVGPSGGGKTTITKLLLRFLELGSGVIAIDGQEIRSLTQKSLREAIAYVPQEALLFHRSLLENIGYARPDATESDILSASKLARAHEFIERLPNGYGTLVGERGIKLSGGQRQRIVIARAILKNAPILVLDEATSSLDSESERYIQEGLWELMKDKTAIVIAHRLSTIRHLDRIIVLEEGKIVQDGTHAELVSQDGLYARLWFHQSGGFLEDSVI